MKASRKHQMLASPEIREEAKKQEGGGGERQKNVHYMASARRENEEN